LKTVAPQRYAFFPKKDRLKEDLFDIFIDFYNFRPPSVFEISDIYIIFVK